MKFLSHMRSKSKLKNYDEARSVQNYRPQNRISNTDDPYQSSNFDPSHPSYVSRLPSHLLRKILIFICPHAEDDSYVSSDDSMIDAGCMLCDMRDLAQCALVKKDWSEASALLLYHSIRIDAVHYCDREIELAAKRRRRSFFERNGHSKENSKDAPQRRLQLFSRTVRADSFLAEQVQFLKMPYMTRESCKSDLARTVSVLPNLRYVDLPEGFYSDDPSSHILKQELLSRCPNIRSMKYQAGAEASFADLGHTRHWRHLEILELSNLNVEPITLVQVLSSFFNLLRIKLSNLSLLDDSIFRSGPSVPPFPPVVALTLENQPNISADGLVAYLSRADAREVFASLTVANTGIHPYSLHKILTAAPYLNSVHISESVARALPPSPIPPLASQSLKTLHYEISSPSATSHALQSPAESYYAYLSSSLLRGSLPSLTSLYALSPSLPSLLLPPPIAPFANTDAPSRSYRILRPLSLYTKSISELEWNLTLITPPSPKNRRGSATATRPVSLHNTGQLSLTWASRGRESVMVGNGFGGFLAVPSDDVRPGTSSGGKNKPAGRGDAWMG